MNDEDRREEILFTQTHKHPHGCGDEVDGSLCYQNLDGTCDRPSCAYFRPTAAEPEFRCSYCGAASFLHPSEQNPPADYCHPEDHGVE